MGPGTAVSRSEISSRQDTQTRGGWEFSARILSTRALFSSGVSSQCRSIIFFPPANMPCLNESNSVLIEIAKPDVVECLNLEIAELDREVMSERGNNSRILDEMSEDMLTSFVGLGDHLVDEITSRRRLNRSLSRHYRNMPRVVLGRERCFLALVIW
jgi:hypothetical protein